jgi:GNAT superfamily N-acetyltransferase
MKLEYNVSVNEDTVTISNKNTTLGYARFSRNFNIIEYIFVHPTFRRKGLGAMMLRRISEELGCRPVPAPPLSKMGEQFFKAMQPQ